MPILHIDLHPGKTLTQKRELVQGVTRAVVDALACPPELVEIILRETPKDAWSVGGTLKSDS